MSKKNCTLLILVLSMCQMAFSQQNAQFKAQKERILQEKLRIKDMQLLQEMVTAFYANPGNHPNTATSPTPTNALHDRNTEVVVHGGEEVESEVHAAINPTDTANILVGSILSDAENLENPLVVPIYYTTNFGSTWNAATFNSNPNAEFVAGGGDPVFAFDKDGKAYISWLILAISPSFDLKISLYLASSTDKGATWTFNDTPIDIGEASLFTEEGEFVDKQWMAVDQNPTSTYEGRLYTIYVRLVATGGSEINLKWKEKTETTFSPRIKVHQGTYAFMQFSSIDVAKNGDVHVLFTAGNDENDVALYHAKSTDGGTTFAPEEKISDIVFNTIFEDAPATEISGIEPTRLYPCPHLKCGLTSNDVYATWSCKGIDVAGSTGYDVYFAQSTDSGATWAAAKRIGNTSNDDISHQYYPSIAVSPSGKICVTYYDRTEDPNGSNTHYNITVSNNGGMTFSTGTNVSAEPSNFDEIGEQNQDFGIGEYTQVVTTGSYAIPVWSDGRTGGGDIDVYAALVNITGSVAVENLTTIADQFELQIANPSNTLIKAHAVLHAKSKLKWEVMDAQGKLISRIMNELSLPPGTYTETIQVPQSGVYFVSLTTEYGKNTQKIVVTP